MAPTFEVASEAGLFYVIVGVRSDLAEDPAPPVAPKPYLALVDLGAQCTLISDKVVSELGLISYTMSEYRSANAEIREAEKFRLRLSDPLKKPDATQTASTEADWDSSQWHQFDVLGLGNQPEYFDLLLGTDYLSLFHITTYKQRMILST